MVLRSGQQPNVAGAVAFVAGGVFTALVNLAATEFSAERADRRLQRRELKELRLAAVGATQRWASAYADYVRDTWVNESRAWNPEPHSAARLSLIGDEAILRRFCAALSTVLRCDPTHPPAVDDMVELEAAEEAVHRVLVEQIDRIAGGDDPKTIPEATVDEASSQVSLARQWYSELGLEERVALTATQQEPEDHRAPDESAGT
jgi:hypothetical protein